MYFQETQLKGAFIVDLERREDARGFFARAWCAEEFAARNLNSRLVQCNISFNPHRGTLRGMHFQSAPHEEAKIARCTMGAIYDVIIDLRPASPTYMQHFGLELNAQNRRMLFIPEGFAHGFQTLMDDTEVFYQMSNFYHPESANGVRWNDPAFGIDWPLPDAIMADKDRAYPNFTPVATAI